MKHLRSGDAHSVVLFEVAMQPAFLVLVISGGTDTVVGEAFLRLREPGARCEAVAEPETWAVRGPVRPPRNPGYSCQGVRKRPPHPFRFAG